MAEIINLRQIRKAKARAEADTKAEANRIAFGQPKKAKTLQQRRKALETERTRAIASRGTSRIPTRTHDPPP